MRLSNTCNSKTTNKWYIVISFIAWLFFKFSPCNEYGGSRGWGVRHPKAKLIGRTNQKIQSRWMMKCKIEMSARSDICIFPFEPFSTRRCHLIQPLRNIVHFKSDVWLAPPAAILIEMSFGCAAGEPGQGRTAVPVSIGWNQLLVPFRWVG